MKSEIFKPIIGYNDMYQVSNLGRVKSLRFNKEKILKPGLDSYGYHIYGLFNNKKPKSERGHQLVAEAFLGHTRCGSKLVVDHIDRNPCNNNADNLRIISHRENLSRSLKGASGYTGVFWNKQNKKWFARYADRKLCPYEH